VAKGEPGAGYAFSWSVYQWLDGESANADRIADPVRFAVDLAEFLAALQSFDATGGPRPGLHNWFRGGTLRRFDGEAQRGPTALDGRIDVELAREIWKTSLDAGWDGVETWFHGDVASGNLLVKDGRLAAVIDFGTCGVGDPACDLAVAWTLLTADGRQAFRDRLSVDRATWARGRGWALWKMLATCASTWNDTDEAATSARHALSEIFAEYTADPMKSH
jgi:aminoglycoside phosphotransferase (APT) family kinase protein